MANPSHDKGVADERELFEKARERIAMQVYKMHLPSDESEALALFMLWQDGRATPPSPSTAPDGRLRPRYKAEGNRVVREHGGLLAQTHIPAEAVYIANALNEQAERLSSRPAEVDDEGLPALPKKRGTIYPGNYWTDCDEADPPGVPLADIFTAEQYRQGQRDAVAADRARRGQGGA